MYGLCGWSNNLIRKAVLPSLLLVNKPGDERVTVINRTKKVSLFVGVLPSSKIMSRFAY